MDEKEKLEKLTITLYIENPDSKTAFEFVRRICEYELAKLTLQLAREPLIYTITEPEIPRIMRDRETFNAIKRIIENANLHS